MQVPSISNNFTLPPPRLSLPSKSEYESAYTTFEKTYLNLPDKTLHTQQEYELRYDILTEWNTTIYTYFLDVASSETSSRQERTESYKKYKILQLAKICCRIGFNFFQFSHQEIHIPKKELSALIINLNEAWNVAQNDELPKSLLEDIFLAYEQLAILVGTRQNLSNANIVKQKLKSLTLSHAVSSSLHRPTAFGKFKKPIENSKFFEKVFKLQSKIQNLITSPKTPSLEEVNDCVTELLLIFIHDNFPFQLPENINPNDLLKTLILATLKLNRNDAKQLILKPTFTSLFNFAIPEFISEIHDKLYNTSNGFYYALEIAKGGDRKNLKLEQVYIFLRDIGIPEQGALLNHSFTFEDLQKYVWVVECYLIHYRAKTLSDSESKKIHLLHIQQLLSLIKDPLDAYCSQREETHPSVQLRNQTHFLSEKITQFLQQDEINLTTIFTAVKIPPEVRARSDLVNEYIYNCFLEDPDNFMKGELQAVCNKLKNGLEHAQVIQWGSICIHFILRAKKLEENPKRFDQLTTWYNSILAFMINNRFDERICRQQKACITQLSNLNRGLGFLFTFENLLKCKQYVEKIIQVHQIPMKAFSKPYGCKKSLPIISKASEDLRNIQNMMHLAFFNNTTKKAIKKLQANRSQFNLLGFNLSGNLETVDFQRMTSSPSASACGTIAAYATYFQMQQNLSAEKYPSPPLEDIMHYGTSRYQALQRQLELEPQLENLRRAIGANSAEYNQLRNEVVNNVDRERRHLLPEEIFSKTGFQTLLEHREDNILQIVLKYDSHKQYLTLLKQLAAQIPQNGSSNQIGALLSKLNTFSSIVIMVKNKSLNLYSVTFTDSHGSQNPYHSTHCEKAFQITFPSLKLAAQFLSIHMPHYESENRNRQVDQGNTVTLYPVSLATAPEHIPSQLKDDTGYLWRIKEATSTRLPFFSKPPRARSEKATTEFAPLNLEELKEGYDDEYKLLPPLHSQPTFAASGTQTDFIIDDYLS